MTGEPRNGQISWSLLPNRKGLMGVIERVVIGFFGLVMAALFGAGAYGVFVFFKGKGPIDDFLVRWLLGDTFLTIAIFFISIPALMIMGPGSRFEQYIIRKGVRAFYVLAFLFLGFLVIGIIAGIIQAIF